MDIETIRASLEEDVRRWRGLAALAREPALRDAYLQKAAALSAAAEIVGHFGHPDTLGQRDGKTEPDGSGTVIGPAEPGMGPCAGSRRQ